MPREFRLPDLGEGLTESEIVSWRIAAGDHVELNQIIADVETAKAVVELPSPVDGVVQALHAEPGDTVEVGTTIVTFELEGDPQPAVDPVETPRVEERPEGTGLETPDETPDDDTPQPNLVGYGAGPERAGRPQRRPRRAAAAAPASTTPGRSTPPVRALAAQRGIDISHLTGTGPDGLVTREDVLAVVEPVETAAAAGIRRTPIKGVRKHTAAAMVQSAFTAPHATCFLTIDVTATMELVDRLRAASVDGTPRIGFLAVLARAFVIALRRHPELNSRWDESAQEIHTYPHVHLGIAAATDRGLIVPHVPDAQALTLEELATALAELTQAARAGTTPLERLTGSTISISNLGVFGVDAGTPILNPGEAAILAVGAVQRRPWEHRGELALRQVLTLSLSFDHRVVDGAEASRFLAELGALLTEPGLAIARDAGRGPLFDPAG